MAWKNYEAAYQTRLGNLTAKSLLVCLIDEGNAEEGLGFAGLKRIAMLTEINKRTVYKLLNAFERIDLVSRTEATLKGKVRPAFQVNLARLGLDLRDEFARAYALESCKPVPVKKCLRGTRKNASRTQQSASEAQRSVCEAQPPHPLIGGPVLVPVVSPSPQPPQAGASELNLALDRAVDQVSSALDIPEDQRRKRKLIRSALKRATEKGDLPATLALEMIAAVRDQDRLHFERALKFKFGLQKFLGEGIWRDRYRWAWDPQEMRLQGEARAGSQ